MSERTETLKQNLTDARNILNQALDAIGDREDEQIYSEGAEWTLKQLAIHLALADIGHNRMVSHYSEGKEFIPADYNIEHYNKRSVEKKADMSLANARASLKQSRAEFMAWLDDLEDEAVLDKTGRHAILKIMTIEEIIGIMCGHEIAHANDINAMIANA